MEFKPQSDSILIKNKTEEELFLDAKSKQSNPQLPSAFLIRLHNLPKDKDHDFVLDLVKRQGYIFGQRDSDTVLTCEEYKENWEFINLIDDDLLFSSLLSPTHFKIEKQNQNEHLFFISDYQSEHGTFLNGKRLKRCGIFQLQNGDIISLGISHEDPNCEFDNGKFWVFKFRTMSIEEETRCKEFFPHIFENEIILSNILSHLGNVVLKSICPVSKFWNEATIPIIKSQLTISELSINLQSAPIKEKISKFSQFCLSQLHILEETKKHAQDIPESFLNFFNNFFTNCSQQITSINLDFGLIISEDSPTNKMKLLQLIMKECPNLEKLKINQNIPIELCSCSKIKSLRLQHELHKEIEELSKLFPSLEDLSIQAKLVVGIPKFCKFWNDFENLQILRIWGIWNDFRMLANLPQNLKVLELLDCFMAIEPNHPWVQQVFGAKYCYECHPSSKIVFPKLETLERLTIHLKTFNGELLVWRELELKGFEKLKVLAIVSNDEGNGEIFMEKILKKDNLKFFPQLEIASVVWGQRRSKNFAATKLEKRQMSRDEEDDE